MYCCRKGQRNDARCESCLLGFTEKNHEVSHGMRVFIDWSRCVTMHVLVFDEACFRIVSVRKCISFHSGNLSDQHPLVIFGPSAISTTAQVSIPQLLDLTLLQQLIPHLKCRCGTQWQRRQKWDDSGSCWKRKMKRCYVHIRPHPFSPIIGFLYTVFVEF